MAVPCLSDSDTIHHDQDTGGALVSDVIIDPATDNLLSDSASGLLSRFAPPLVSALPASPYDGQVVFYEDATIGSPMMFRYDAASVSAYKWDYLGGAPNWYAKYDTSDTYTSATYGALGVHVTLDIPGNITGDFLIHHGTRINGPGSAERAFQSLRVGAVAASDANAVATTTNDQITASSQPIQLLGVAANTTIGLHYRTESGGTATYSFRWLAITPVRVAAA